MDKFLEELARWSQMGWLGAFGGAAAYVYGATAKNKPFRWIGFAANLFVAFFVGRMMGDLYGALGWSMDYRDGLVMASGFCAYPILRMLETQLAARLQARLFKSED